MTAKKIDTGLDNKRVGINMIFSIVSFVLNLFVSFFITPYITSNLGSEAYGFLKLANDFADYASLISLALNSMATRFIMLKRENNEEEAANKYYSSITVANIILAAIMAVPAILCVVFLQHLVSVPAYLIVEVKVTFAITFANFLINLLFTTVGCSYYLANRLDINSIRTAESTIIRVICIIVLYALFTPKISYMAFGSLFAAVVLIRSNISYHKKLTPDLKFNIHNFEKSKVIEVFLAGVWNSITKLSKIFLSGLDLLVTNLFIGSQEMGYLSVAKTVPNMIDTFNSTIASAFSPNMMQLYAKGDLDRLKTAAKSSMKFMCIFVSVPSAILITMGKDFFSLWVPNQPTELINILSILTAIGSCVSGPIQPLYMIFTMTNKVKQNSIVMIIYGVLSISITYLCLRMTNLGLYAVAGVSSLGSIIVTLAYHVPFSAKYVGLPWHTFYPEMFKSILSLIVQCIVGVLVNAVLPLDSSWIAWFFGAAVSGMIGLFINAIIILTKEERIILIEMAKSRFKINK